MTLLLKYLILLTVGVFANVAVVWSSAILVDPAQSERTIIDSSYSDGRYSLWKAEVWELSISTRVEFNAWIGCGNATVPAPSHVPMDAPWWSDRSCLMNEHNVVPSQQAHGWPMRAMWCEFEYDLPTVSRRSSAALGGWEWPWQPKATTSWEYRKTLPLRPIWQGFAINSVLFTALFWTLLFLPMKLRRTIRARHRRCASCGYPLGTSPVCTECGAAVRVVRSAR